LTNFGAAAGLRGGMDLLLKMIGLPGKMEVHGSQVQELYEQGRLEEIHRYCRNDVVQTYFLFLRVELMRGRIDDAGYRLAREASAHFLAEIGAPPATSAPPPGAPDTAPKISLIVITRNEEELIGQCLKSAATFCDELIVVDSFSTDRTAEIARGLGARVFQRPFEGYIAQKQFALEQARGEWVLSLDADEQATWELGREI